MIGRAPEVQREQLAAELLSNLDRVKDLVGVVLATPERPAGSLEKRIADLERERDALLRDLDQLSEQHGRLMSLYVATYQLHTSLDPERVQDTVADIATNLLGAERFALLLRRQRSGWNIALGVGTEELLGPEGQRYDGGDPLVDATLADGELRLEPVDGSPAVAGIPIKVEDTLVGALVIFKLLDQKPQLREADRDLIDLLAAHSATALIVSRIYTRTTRKLQTIEALMGLGEEPPEDGAAREASRGSSAFSGNLEDLQAVDLVQFLHYNGHSGTLVLERGGEQGSILFRAGRILAAVAPEHPGIEERLLHGGLVTRAALEEAQGLALAEGRPLGSILVESGRVSLDALMAAVHVQVEEAAQSLLAWADGHFQFELGQADCGTMVGLPAEVLLDNLLINTQRLLLEAVRAKDERTRARETESEASTAQARSEQTTGVISEKTIDEIFERVLRKQPARAMAGRGGLPPVGRELRSAFDSVRTSLQTSSVAANLLELVARGAERGILFVVHGRELIPTGAFGANPGGQPLTSLVSRRIAVQGGALERVVAGGRAEVAATGDAGLPEDLFRSIGGPAAGRVALIPVSGGAQPLLVIYADNGELDEPPDGLDLVEMLAMPIGFALENQLLRRAMRPQSK